ncbi:putative ABC transport system ATP-binding protein [Paenibacillus anaericanus]|uniref:ABC transporter ATP-binding protein n=1 Tax=Paenibacillus TaxID=44249 RepID=UPI002781C48F|nr:ABC transporter ATP-binding protein [Paenibacillus anaericanus]MDQ0087305.1 putative ABC transport system ATP-binding protein [Paenibacillus anaericanus]
MLHIQGLKKGFQVAGKDVPILNIPEWTVSQGEKLAMIGPSGSGKSTLLHLISGILSPDKGEIIMREMALHQMSESVRDRFRAENIGYILQDFHLIPSLMARQNVEIVMSGNRSKTERRELIDFWFEKVGLSDRSRHLPSQLSRGQQQRVAMIRALINEPKLVLADEPTGSLDWETADEVTGLLLDLCASKDHTLIVVTHDLNMADRFEKCVHIHEINELRSARSRSYEPVPFISS